MDIPDVRYARAGSVAIAFQVVGEGPRTLLHSPPLSDLYSIWAAPFSRPFLDRLAAELRLIVFNPRGTGFSDRPRDISLEAGRGSRSTSDRSRASQRLAPVPLLGVRDGPPLPTQITWATPKPFPVGMCAK